MTDEGETDESPREAQLRAENEAERWLVSLAAGWAYVDEETRERALSACMEDGLIHFRPLLSFLAKHLVMLGSTYVEPGPLAWAVAELEHLPCAPRNYADVLEHLDTVGVPPIEQLLATASQSRLRRRLVEVACRLGFAAQTADLPTVQWLLSFVELHALPDPPTWFALDEDDDDDEPTAHQWEQVITAHEAQHPETKRRRLPLVNTSDFSLWFILHNCAFMKMMRARDDHDYNLWVALASQLQPFGARGRDAFLQISAQDRELAPEIVEQKWEQTRALSPMRCTTIEKQGWRCPHLDTVRCNGAPTPALLADHSYCEPMEVDVRW